MVACKQVFVSHKIIEQLHKHTPKSVVNIHNKSTPNINHKIITACKTLNFSDNCSPRGVQGKELKHAC